MGHGMDVIKLAQHGLLTGFVVWGLLPQVHAKTWVLTDTSRISFDIKTVGLSAVKGVSNQSQAKLYFDINTPQNASVQVIFPTNSLKFNNPALRAIVLGESFFYSAKYQTATFKSTEFLPQGQDYYTVAGDLTLRGITKPVIFEAMLKPNVSNPKLLDVDASGIINRSDFGMKKAYGGVGEKVNIQLIGQWQVK